MRARLLSQVIADINENGLEKAQSPTFYPRDPIKAGGIPSLQLFNAPVVHVEANHLYYSRLVPPQPPCPKHGWEAEVCCNVVQSRICDLFRKIIVTYEQEGQHFPCICLSAVGSLASHLIKPVGVWTLSRSCRMAGQGAAVCLGWRRMPTSWARGTSAAGARRTGRAAK